MLVSVICNQINALDYHTFLKVEKEKKMYFRQNCITPAIVLSYTYTIAVEQIFLGVVFEVISANFISPDVFPSSQLFHL